MNTIRTVRREDLSALLELYVHLNPDNRAVPDDALLLPAWERILSDPNVYCFVAEAGGVLTGSCLLAVAPNLTRGARSFGVIENVVTHRDYRRQGIGTRLMHHALQTAWDAGCYKVMLLSGAWREDAHRLYAELGFTRDSKVGFVAAAPWTAWGSASSVFLCGGSAACRDTGIELVPENPEAVDHQEKQHQEEE